MQVPYPTSALHEDRETPYRPNFGLRHLLLLLMSAVLLPPLAAGGVVTWHAIAAYHTASEERLQSTARALALAVEGEIARIRPALMPLAAAPLIDEDASLVQLAEFHRLSAAQATAFGTWIWLSGPRPDLLPIALTTRLPFGAPLPPPSDPNMPGPYATILEVARTGRPVVSPIYQSSVFGQPMATTAVPVIRDGRLVRVLAAALDPWRLSAILAAQGLTKGAVAVLVDDRGTVAARSVDANAFVGQAIPAWRDWVRTARGARVVKETALDGQAMIFGFSRLGDVAPGWTMLVGEPQAAYEASWRQPLLWLGGIAAAAFGAATLAAMWLARCLLRPMAALTKRATEVVRSAGPSADAENSVGRTTEASGIAELDALGDAFERADAALQREAAATRRERDLLQSVIDGCGDAIFVKDTEGRYLLINSAGSRVLGRPPADVLGRTNETLMPAAVASKLGKVDREVMADGQVRFTEDTVLQDGQPRQFQSSKSPWRELGTGRVLGLIGVARDVTELRREEERRRTAEADLQRLARRATAGAMAGGIAHEVNQPLTALANYLGAARRLLDRADTPLDPLLVTEARKLVVQAGSEAVRAGEILRHLREFVGKGGAPPGPELVQPLLEEAVALVLAGRPSDASRVRICVAEDVGAVWADRVAVQQVLVNLVRNALEATSTTGGQVSLTATRQAPTMTDAEMVKMTVADQGPGLAPEIRASLFEAFVTTKPDGMGLGLSISRTIVEEQGGRIWTEPRPEGRGAVFHFTLVAVELGAEACPVEQR
jgi:PAS domain S-box-containing protein